MGREKKNAEAEVYSAIYGGQWMKNYPFSIQISIFYVLVHCLMSSVQTWFIEFSLQTFKSPMVCHSWGQI